MANGTKKPAFQSIIPTGKGESVLGSVWDRVIKANGGSFTVYSIQIQSSYTEEAKEGGKKERKYGSSFKPGQLDALAYVLRRCEDFVFAAKDKANKGDAHEGSGDNEEIPY